MDVARVRRRVKRSLRDHLRQQLPAATREMFGCYVGGALMVHEDAVPVERLLYRTMEEAFADALREREREERKHLLNLRQILEAEQIRSVYQPVVDVLERRIIGFEALSRVTDGTYSSPETLFKIAQENNSLWNLERLCRRKALDGLPAIAPHQLLFLNIEPDSIHDPELMDPGFLALLGEAGLTPRQIVLEMTEHSAIQDFAAVRRTLGAFRNMGFRLAMDDVGSGYSGLQAITEIAPDFIKIDMTLVRDLHNHPIKRELISTIRKFTDATGISLVAEGVESPEELESLIDAGVRCAQGYLFAKPSESPSGPDWRLIPGMR
jgi:EAL domain-containing protein (putative c-di-GMP-specific phosphodiesterase class I)